MESQEELARRVKKLEERNRSVENDKAWETSLTRRAVLTVSTYLVLGIYMFAVDIERPWINAIVPTCGFMLSTLSLPVFKKIWNKYNKK